jgi:hypothetical protein
VIIGRFEVPRDDQEHEVGFWGGVLAINAVSVDLIEFWAMIPDDPTWAMAPRRMLVVGTGQPLPGGMDYCGTVIVPLPGSRAVWHLIELTP